ncbi:hypothetical protein RND71_037372 [Anisodus tanguticus]|uniref:Uncharacterized protein n=1 Tax=Anisodus tanguticus TaxID=243964 RepID=A0AAE1R382_9SOLA|nr:hypothetical protein RND71_037372 [Anisodus tanguticus]
MAVMPLMFFVQMFRLVSSDKVQRGKLLFVGDTWPCFSSYGTLLLRAIGRNMGAFDLIHCQFDIIEVYFRMKSRTSRTKLLVIDNNPPTMPAISQHKIIQLTLKSYLSKNLKIQSVTCSLRLD